MLKSPNGCSIFDLAEMQLKAKGKKYKAIDIVDTAKKIRKYLDNNSITAEKMLNGFERSRQLKYYYNKKIQVKRGGAA